MTSSHLPRRGARPWVRGLIIAFLVVANVVVFGGLYLANRVAGKVRESVPTIPPTESIPLAPRPEGLKDPRTFLVIGSDSRDQLPDEFDDTGSFPGQRADVIMLMQVLPGEGRLQVLSLPRDLRVELGGQVFKINAAFNNGPARMVEVATHVTQLPIHHFIQVDFAGFAGIVDAVGGVELTFDNPARDTKSKLSVDAGRQTLDGRQALAYARSRSYQELIDGSWQFIDANDLGRTRRQQRILIALLSQIQRPSNPDELSDLIDSLGGFLTTDDSLTADDILELGWEMRSIGGEDVDALTIPVRFFDENGVSYVVEKQPDAALALEAFRDGALFASVTEPIRIEVQNGNGVDGAAGAVGGLLESKGFSVVNLTNAGTDTVEVTVVTARPNKRSQAESVVAALGFGVVETGAVPNDVDVVVLLGADSG